MGADGIIHSRIVRWLKIVLPLLALAILSTLFLFSRKIDTDAALPYASVDVDALMRDPRLTDPEFSTVTKDGAALTVAARIARTATGDGADADDLVAVYDTPDGLRIAVVASQGQIDQRAARLHLTGDVEIVTSTGYRMLSDSLDTALDRTDLLSDSAVTVEAPYGTIEAGRMRIDQQDAQIPGYKLVFNEGVKLVYQPE